MTSSREDPDKVRRVVVYVKNRDHKKLKAKLSDKGLSVSAWFRSLVRKELNRDL